MRRLSQWTTNAFVAIAISIVASFSMAPRAVGESHVNGFSNDPNFFPIGVWLQSPARAPQYKSIGINTFIGLWQGPTEAHLAELASAGMFVVAEQNSTALNSPNRQIIKAWMHSDEPDNAQPIGAGLYGTCIPALEIARRSRLMKSRDATRPVFINFGQGVANPYWKGRGPCTGDEDYYKIAAQDADILSFDVYPVASNIPEVKGKLEYVAQGVLRLKALSVEGQSVWAILETTALDPSNRVLPAQIRAEVWMALIHGAGGIVYFVHEFKPSFREDAIFKYPDVVEEISRLNRLITSLAPVLNSNDAHEEVSAISAVPIAVLIKRYDKNLYIFAVSMENAPSSAKFVINGLNGADAIVVDESRSVSIRNGTLEDGFPSYGVHIYKITRP